MKTPVKCYKDIGNTLKVESFYHIVIDQNDDQWSFPLHDHSDFLEISLIIKGEADFECAHKKYTLHPGDLVIKNAGVLHSEISAPKAPFEQYCLGISGVQSEDMPPNKLVPPEISPVFQTGDAYDYLHAMTGYLYNLSCNPSLKASELTRQAIENEISVINMLIRDAVETSDQEPHSDLIMNVLEHLDAHYGTPANLETIAGQFFVSPYYLAHKFKKEVGCTINQYLLNRRLGEAQRRLVFSDDPIKEIASDCGYSNLQYFYSVFRKHVGRTPNSIRSYYNQIRASL